MKKILLFLLLVWGATTQAQEFKRNIESRVFIPKGQWIVGSSVSYSEHNEQNYQFLIIDGFNSDGYSFKVSPMLCYAFRDNLAAGGRFSYGRTLTKLDGVALNLDENTQLDVSDLYQLKHSYSAIGVLRNYINLGTSKRFALFAETRLELGGSQSKAVTKNGDSVSGTYSKTTDFGIGVAPGIVAFINNYTAIEVSIGVLGLDFSKVKQTTDQVYIGERSSSSANFKINLFSIGLGIAFYL